ncbi:MAG: polysaccharide deacetylase family protein [Actinobacteria bacterium]|nr:polysaccharide deacetylase family protein [Actinomycetota bacterium]
MTRRLAVLVVVSCQVLVMGWLLLTASTPAGAAGLPPSEWVIGPQKRVAMITFEGKTSNQKLHRVLRVLRKRHARASFFFPGRWLNYHEKRARRVHRRGHALGNRGYGRASFTSLDESAIRSSVARSQRILRRIGSYPRPFLRLPGGVRDSRTLRIAGSMGYRSVRWTHHPGGGPADGVKRRVVRKAQAGSVIALDIRRKSNRRALPGIIKGLRRRGFRLKTINALDNAHAIRWDITLRPGSSGAETYYLDRTLRSISYPSGGVNSSFDYPTLQAVYAFEKVHHMTRDAVVTPSEMTRIAVSQRPRAPKRRPKSFVDIDISRQVLFEVRNRTVVRTHPISSGNEAYYTYDGITYRSHTPRGSYSVVRKIAGWRTSFLGRLYYPSYFVGGFAVHGSTSVPTYPASHGCVRIPMYVTKGFFYRNPIGRPVFVHD